MADDSGKDNVDVFRTPETDRYAAAMGQDPEAVGALLTFFSAISGRPVEDFIAWGVVSPPQEIDEMVPEHAKYQGSLAMWWNSHCPQLENVIPRDCWAQGPAGQERVRELVRWLVAEHPLGLMSLRQVE